MNKLVSTRRKGLSWKEILAEKRKRKERRLTNTITVLVSSLLAVSLLVVSVAIKGQRTYLSWKRRTSDDKESVRDLFTKEERKILEERANKLKKKED